MQTDRDPDGTRACVAGGSTSAKLVYKLLEYEGEQPLSALIESSGLSRSGVEAGVKSLKRCDAVEERYHPTDARRKVYRLR
ncbi:MarR family transcriptional regulator [Halegenticoccus soli]|uniref:MarR family transcriptional regulator n=1 Tax=Halegenticoccus soli TaxID=1985678 RepID=UPI000C6EB6C0|nr:MarR family transcriptional regulator [Halegenticoccus soli]